jgi:hypothetical protein
MHFFFIFQKYPSLAPVCVWLGYGYMRPRHYLPCRRATCSPNSKLIIPINGKNRFKATNCQTVNHMVDQLSRSHGPSGMWDPPMLLRKKLTWRRPFPGSARTCTYGESLDQRLQLFIGDRTARSSP